LVGIGPEDIAMGNIKLLLGLLWTIILRYHINIAGSVKAELLDWVRQQVKPYDIRNKEENLKNCTSDWQDGTVLSALTDSLKPGVITPHDMSAITRTPLKDIQKAISTAEEIFGIPAIMDAEDIVDNPDELSLLTYLSYFRNYCVKAGNKDKPEQEKAIESNQDACNLNVEGLPEETTEEVLSALFSRFPGFKGGKMVQSKKGVAVVEFASENEGRNVIDCIQNFPVAPLSQFTITLQEKRS